RGPPVARPKKVGLRLAGHLAYGQGEREARRSLAGHRGRGLPRRGGALRSRHARQTHGGESKEAQHPAEFHRLSYRDFKYSARSLFSWLVSPSPRVLS